MQTHQTSQGTFANKVFNRIITNASLEHNFSEERLPPTGHKKQFVEIYNVPLHLIENAT